MADWLLVDHRQFHKLHHIDAAVPAFALGHEIRRAAHHRRNVMLR